MKAPRLAILSLAIDKKIWMFVSAAVLAEYEEVLCRPRLKFDPKHIEAPWPISVTPPNWFTPQRFLELVVSRLADYRDAK